jgi:hypothetical protein
MTLTRGDARISSSSLLNHWKKSMVYVSNLISMKGVPKKLTWLSDSPDKLDFGFRQIIIQLSDHV